MNFYNSFKLTTRKFSFVIAAALAIMCMSARLADKTNFTGEWTLNEQKSAFGEGPRFTPKKLKVDQAENALSVERTTSFNGEDRVTPEKLTLDGKETENLAFGTFKRT